MIDCPWHPYVYYIVCPNCFQVVRALNLIRDSWEAFGSKPESDYIPRGTLQVSMLSDDPIVLFFLPRPAVSLDVYFYYGGATEDVW